MGKKVLSICMGLLLVSIVHAQNERQDSYLPTVGVKTNLLYVATTTPNLGVEFGLSPKLTLDISANYNPWAFSNNKKIKHWLVQPELRYWFCERFNGAFVGLHAHYAEYNVGGIKMLGLKNVRYEGNLYGGGVSVGYHWILNKRWSLEATIGAGYAYLDYSKYKCEKCGDKLKDGNRNYWGPTKAGVNLIYMIK